MKLFLSFLAIVSMFVSCQKSIDPLEDIPNKCRVIKIEYELDSSVIFTHIVSYDSLKRIKSILLDNQFDSLIAFYNGNTPKLTGILHSWRGMQEYVFNNSNYLVAVKSEDESSELFYKGSKLDSATLLAFNYQNAVRKEPRIGYKFKLATNNSISSFHTVNLHDGDGGMDATFEYDSRKNPLKFLAPFDFKSNLSIGPLLPLSSLGYGDEFLIKTAKYNVFGSVTQNFESRYEYEFDSNNNLVVCKLITFMDGRFSQTTRLLFSYECD